MAVLEKDRGLGCLIDQLVPPRQVVELPTPQSVRYCTSLHNTALQETLQTQTEAAYTAISSASVYGQMNISFQLAEECFSWSGEVQSR